MPSRESEPLESRIFRRRFRDREVIETLDGMELRDAIAMLGEPGPVVREWYAEPKGYWRQGDGRPALADDDPAVMQAMGRCSASRIRSAFPIPSSIHPEACAWCDYPVAELLRACDWATWQSRYLTSESLTWSNDMGQTYVRAGRSAVYCNPTWARFWTMPDHDRQRAIAAAQYPTEAAA